MLPSPVNCNQKFHIFADIKKYIPRFVTTSCISQSFTEDLIAKKNKEIDKLYAQIEETEDRSNEKDSEIELLTMKLEEMEQIILGSSISK